MKRTHFSSELRKPVTLHNLISGFIVAGFLLVGSGASFCSEPIRQPDRSDERLEVLTTWRMMEALNMDKPTAEKIMAVRHKSVMERKTLQKKIAQDFQKVRELLREDSSRVTDDALAGLLQDIRDNRVKIQGLFDEYYNEVSKLLSIRQQAELMLFLKDFHNEIRAGLRSANPPGLQYDKNMTPPPSPTRREMRRSPLQPGNAN